MYQLSIYRIFHPQKTLCATVEYPVPQQNIRCHSGTFSGTIEVGSIVRKKCRSSSDIDNTVCAIHLKMRVYLCTVIQICCMFSSEGSVCLLQAIPLNSIYVYL